MSTSRTKNLDILFEMYAKNLNWYIPDLVDVILCPLCLQPFRRDAIHSRALTLEHIIPQALGGKLFTITCSDCNSKSGTKLDAHLIQRLRTEDILTGKSKKPLRIQVQIGSGEFGADLYLSSDNEPNIQIVGIPAISNPLLHMQANQSFDTKTKKLSIKGNLGFKEISSRVALLRIAYLLAFSYFGYGYILHENLNQVRRQIFEPTNLTDVLNGMVWITRTERTNVIGLLRHPQELRSFFAIIGISTERKRVAGVSLPGLDTSDSDLYQRWGLIAPTLDANTEPVIDVIDLKPSYLYEPENKHLPFRIWSGQVTIVESGKE